MWKDHRCPSDKATLPSRLSAIADKDVNDIVWADSQPIEDLLVAPYASYLMERLLAHGLPRGTFAVHLVYR